MDKTPQNIDKTEDAAQADDVTGYLISPAGMPLLFYVIGQLVRNGGRLGPTL